MQSRDALCRQRIVQVHHGEVFHRLVLKFAHLAIAVVFHRAKAV